MPFFGGSRTILRQPRERTVAYDYYVDSVLGSDSNSGLTQAAAFASLAPVNAKLSSGMRVGIKSGTAYTGYLDNNNAQDVIVGIYGGTTRAVINCADPLSGFTLVPGTTRNYKKTGVVLAATGEPSQITVQENDVLMQRVSADPGTTDMALGSIYVTADTGTVDITVCASDGGNPNSNGKSYTYSARLVAIRLGDRAIVSGLETKNNRLNDGSIALGALSTLTNCKPRNGHKHNALVGFGSKVTLCDFAEGHKYDDAGIMLVVYSPSGVIGSPDSLIDGNTFTCRGLLATPVECIYAHTSGANGGNNIFISNNVFTDCFGGINASASNISGDVYFNGNYVTLSPGYSTLPRALPSPYVYGGKFFNGNKAWMPEPFATTFTVADKFIEAAKTVVADGNELFLGPYFNWAFGATGGLPDITARNNKSSMSGSFLRLGGSTNALREVTGNIHNGVTQSIITFGTTNVTLCNNNSWGGDGFTYAGAAKTFTQWKALGFDTNSDAGGDNRVLTVPRGGALRNDLSDWAHTLVHVNAQNSASITSVGGFVSAVADLSRGGRNFVLSAPTPANDKVQLQTLGGLPWLTPAARGGLSHPGFDLNAQIQVVAAVVRFSATVSSASGAQTLASFSGNDQQSFRFGGWGGVWANSLFNAYHGGANGYGYFDTGYSIPATTPTLVLAYWDPVTDVVQFRVNGVLIGNMTSVSRIVNRVSLIGKNETLMLLQAQSISNPLAGSLGEFLITGTASTAMVATIEAEMKARWGIA